MSAVVVAVVAVVAVELSIDFRNQKEDERQHSEEKIIHNGFLHLIEKCGNLQNTVIFSSQ